MNLRPYQAQMIDAARQAATRHRRLCMVLPTGGGKSALLGYIASSAASRGRRVLAVVHRRRLVQQLTATMQAWGCADAVPVRSVQSLRPATMEPPDLLLVDECFPAGTLVDGRPIEGYRPGDLVSCYDHSTGRVVMRPVVRLFKSKAPQTMVAICFSNGSRFTCTAGHPVYADGEYVAACKLKPGANVVLSTMPRPDHVPDSLRNVWRRCRPVDQSPQEFSHQKGRMGLLLQPVQQSLSLLGFFSYCGKHQSQVRLGPDAQIKPDAPRRDQGQGFNHIESYGLETQAAGRQWQGTNGATAAFGVNAWMGNGSSRQNRSLTTKPLGFSVLLQTGHWMQSSSHWHRSGWLQPCHTQSKDARQKEGGKASVAWVDSVEIHQRPSDGCPDGMCPDGFVYNLEVAEHHNYFAEGVLVHNCHHLVAGNQWGRLIEAWPDARLIGFTATPSRLDGVGLGQGHGGYFQQLVLGPDARWLTDHGFLAPARVFSWPGPSLAGIRTRMGDLDLQQAEQAMAGLMGDAVTEYQRHLSGRTAIANCCSVAHAESVAAAFRAEGIPAAALTGTVSRQEQDRLFADLADGTLKVLAQCEIVSEGVDIPAVAGALMLRPTQSTVVWLQQLGRALRPAPGKTSAIILDHAGNARRPGLGLPTDPREWTLEGRKRRKGDPVPPVRSCPACFCCVPASVSECPECGHVWQAQVRELKRLDGTLSEMAQEAIRWHRVKEERSCLTLEEWEALGRARGYAPGWGRIRYAARLRRVRV